ncbi:MAG: hypothetical protein MMC33_009237 [Icmadophila ericetorum]|nr:hypothetical protein [Icmadophila ericetorum]
MKPTTLLTLLLTSSTVPLTLTNPLPLPQSTPAPFSALEAACETVGPETYVVVQYENTPNFITYNFDTCYPYAINNGANLAMQALFCRSVTCENNPNPDCSGGAVPPVPVPLPAGTYLPNVADFVQLLGEGATCQANGIPV